jgi:hypothetical protein
VASVGAWARCPKSPGSAAGPGPLTERDLGARLLLTSGGVTVLVDRLERAGLVRRGRHPTDRRTTVVGLVPDPPVRNVPSYRRRDRDGRRRPGGRLPVIVGHGSPALFVLPSGQVCVIGRQPSRAPWR